MTEVALSVAIARCAAGLPVPATDLPARAQRMLAVADRLGAPRAPALQAAAAAEAAAAELARAVEVAAAEGRSVARALVAAPPVLGPVTALVVTETPFAVWSTPLGHAVLLLAAILWLLGGAAVRLLVRQATSPPRQLGVEPSDELLDLVAVALSAGAGLPHALRLAATGRDRGRAVAAALWLELGAVGPPPAGWEAVGPALAAARRDGVPLAAVTRSLAAVRRGALHHQALERAARLGARLTVPTTLLLLPAAVLLVAAPLLDGALALLG